MRRHIHPALAMAVVALAFVTAALPGAAVAAPGDLDPTFGSGGKVLTDLRPASYDTAQAVALQPNGKIVAAGFSDAAAASHNDFALVRYNSDGSLDMGFGLGGKVLTDIGFDSLDWAYAVALQP